MCRLSSTKPFLKGVLRSCDGSDRARIEAFAHREHLALHMIDAEVGKDMPPCPRLSQEFRHPCNPNAGSEPLHATRRIPPP